MTFEIPNGATEGQIDDIERIHELLLNRQGYRSESVLVSLHLAEDKIVVSFGNAVGSME